MTNSVDARARLRALDPETSFIVQAPAGSGKTELLTQRYLMLLARASQPESVVAITFTRKAAGEMRARVLHALGNAATGVRPETPHRAATFELARGVLQRDSAAGWRLLDNPARMRVQTIDALSASITRQMPWLARFGAQPEVTEKARDLYREAAANTLSEVEDEERAGVEGPLSVLLLHLDNNFHQAQTLIAEMLEKREQWLRVTGAGLHPDLPRVRAGLERSFENLIARELDAIRRAIPPAVLRDILFLLDWDELPDVHAESLPEWRRLSDLVLTGAGSLRKKAPPEMPKERCSRLYDNLAGEEDLLAALKDLRRLPPPRFEDAQWEATKAVVAVLPKAVAHLQLVFRARGRVDFAELSIRASAALGHLESPTDLALSLGHRIEHLLVDEFQDTSYTQYQLIEKLTAGWEPGGGRTLFLVGDPMQSIYRFRQADVGLFLKARREGVGTLRLEPLALETNFRSGPAIVGWLNETFSSIFPRHEDIDRGAVPYHASHASRAPAAQSIPPTVHAFLNDSHKEEADRILSLLGQPGSTAILVRSRAHLSTLIPLLRERGIPFQAIEIDSLAERPVIQDLMALTFALLHLADRISWLAVLRAPWCGLTIPDLHAIAGTGDSTVIWELLRRADLQLTPDGAARLNRVLPVLADALDQRGRTSLRALVERTWMRLGGPACVVADSDLADAGAYFDLLEGLEEAGSLAGFEGLRQQVEELFAQPDPNATESLQVMTIHKAKGLEFDTVILPGLGQRARPDNDPLLVWLEQQGELLLAAMGAAREKEKQDPIYRYLNHLEHEKGRQENARLLYVAATRARNQLHLLGCVPLSAKDGLPTPDAGSFLKLLWPAVGHHFLGLATHAQAAQASSRERRIRRLPVDWSLPAPPPPVHWKRAPLEPVRAPEVEYEWVGDMLRHVGTTVHAFLQRIAADGLESWNAARIAGSRPAFQSMLASLGVPPRQVAEAASRVETALLHTLADERGRWVLARHAEARNEYPITGMVDGRLYQAVIDRTFVDEQNVRWIVDYKSSVHEGGSLENFLEEERSRYQPQLEQYARLTAQTDDRPIRLALYFPLLNGWREWAAPTIKRRQASLFE